jgi:hypothetical protein
MTVRDAASVGDRHWRKIQVYNGAETIASAIAQANDDKNGRTNNKQSAIPTIMAAVRAYEF